MTLTTIPPEIWIAIGVALVVAIIIWWALAARRHVEIGTATSDDTSTAPIAPTLARVVSVTTPPITLPEIEARLPLVSIAPIEGPNDDLRVMKGVGPKLVARLGELGVTRFEHIAAWTDADIAAIDARLGAFAGRIGRDRWVEQARLLASGDNAGFEAAFGRLDPIATQAQAQVGPI